MLEENDKFAAEIMCSLRKLPVESVSLSTAIVEQQSPKETKKKQQRPTKSRVSLKHPHKGWRCTPYNDDVYNYPKLILDSLGGGSPILFRSTMISKCHPDVELLFEYTGQGDNPYGPNLREVHGVEQLTNFLLAFSDAAPDVWFQVGKNIKTSKHEKTGEYFQSWTCLMSMTRTKKVLGGEAKYEMEDNEVTVNQKKIRRDSDTTTGCTTSNSSTSSGANVLSPNTSNEDIESLTDTFEGFTITPIVPTEMKMTFNLCQFCFEINSDAKITKWLGTFDVFEERPPFDAN